MSRPDVNTWCLLHLLSFLPFRIDCLTEHGTHQLRCISMPVSSRKPPVSTFPALGLKAYAAAWGFICGWEGSERRSSWLCSRHLTHKPTPQPALTLLNCLFPLVYKTTHTEIFRLSLLLLSLELAWTQNPFKSGSLNTEQQTDTEGSERYSNLSVHELFQVVCRCYISPLDIVPGPRLHKQDFYTNYILLIAGITS